MRIMLTEDDSDVAEELSIALRRHGHEVTRVADGQSAIESHEDVNLILLDLTLPDLDGLAQATNRYGWTVGTDGKGYVELHTDQGTLRLPAITQPTQSTDNIAVAISDDGRTIGGQSVLADADRTIVAVVWLCK